MVQNRQRLWCTALAVLQKTRGEEVIGVYLLGMVSRREIIKNITEATNIKTNKINRMIFKSPNI
jgi:hypothetical protein